MQRIVDSNEIVLTFHPEVDQELVIGNLTYHLAEHLAAPGVPYGQEGRQAVVYQLVAQDGDAQALKVFEPCCRTPALVSLADRIAVGALRRPANGDHSAGIVAIEPGHLEFAEGNPLRRGGESRVLDNNVLGLQPNHDDCMVGSNRPVGKFTGIHESNDRLSGLQVGGYERKRGLTVCHVQSQVSQAQDIPAWRTQRADLQDCQQACVTYATAR